MDGDFATFQGATVEVGSTPCGTFPDLIQSIPGSTAFTFSKWIRIKCGVDMSGVSGSSVKITLNGTHVLQICGIRVYGQQSDVAQSDIPQIFHSIDLDSNGTPYVVNKEGTIFKQASDNTWEQFHAVMNTHDISINADDEIWKIGTNESKPHELEDNLSWTQKGDIAIALATGSNHTYIVNSDTTISKLLADGTWDPVTGNANDIAVGRGTVFIISSSTSEPW